MSGQGPWIVKYELEAPTGGALHAYARSLSVEEAKSVKIEPVGWDDGGAHWLTFFVETSEPAARARQVFDRAGLQGVWFAGWEVLE